MQLGNNFWFLPADDRVEQDLHVPNESTVKREPRVMELATELTDAAR